MAYSREAQPDTASHEALAEVAYQLYLDVAYAENMDVRGAPNPSGEKASRAWIIKTYGWCYRNAKKARF